MLIIFARFIKFHVIHGPRVLGLNLELQEI